MTVGEHEGKVALITGGGRGFGKAALAEVRKHCAAAGVRALQVETGWENAAAKAVYRQAGFVETGRLHLILKLADPTHIP